jgi:periplasmic copper chaperone A
MTSQARRRPRPGRTARRMAVGLGTIAVVTVGFAVPAWAHVEAELGEVSPTGRAEITFGFQHGCDGAATTALRIQVPEGVSDITLEPVEGFTPNVSDTEFGWSGGSVPDGEEAAFTATAQLTGEEGDVIAFPTIQQCGDVEEAWVEPPETSTGDESTNPSPSIVLPATYAGTTPAPGDEIPTTEPTASTIPSGLVTTTTLSDTATPEEPEENTTGLIVFLVILAILAGGALYLYLSNRRPRPPATPTDDLAGDEGVPDPDGPGSSRSPH